MSRYTLTTTGLKATQDRALPGQLGDDRGLNVGGIFSGLYHAPEDSETIFYAIADRGPNGQVRVAKERRRTFPVPDYNPVIYKLSLQDNQIQIAVGNDNDFGFDSFDSTGRAVNNNLPNELLILRLPQALALTR